MYDQFQIVIGLEVHAQLSTQSKIFASDPSTFGAAPNTHVSPITLAHPGTLPVLNHQVMAYAVQMGLATGGTITLHNQFSRKNYFYPDLPKGYQITQFDTPISVGGSIAIRTEQGMRHIALHHIHLEEDAGKSTHDQHPHYSQIDLNRAGTPLIEIVSQPDMHTSDEAYQYLAAVRQLVQYLGICDGNMEEGSLRCDANVSVRLKGDPKLGERTEIKNMNSLRSVKRAIDYEAQRQMDVLLQGGTITPETRGFDAEQGITFSQRTKEMAHDYRYFPEPDLPPVVLSAQYIEQQRQQLPPLPQALYDHYTQHYHLSAYDAELLTDRLPIATYFDQTIAHTTQYKAVANWLNGTIRSYLNEQNMPIEQLPITPQQLAQIVSLIDRQQISHTAAVQYLFPALLQQPHADTTALAQTLGIIIQTDNHFIDGIIDAVLQKYPNEVQAYLYKGKKNLTGLFMGDIMRSTKGSIDAATATKRLNEKLLLLKK